MGAQRPRSYRRRWSTDGRHHALLVTVPGRRTSFTYPTASDTRTGGSRQEYIVSADGQRFLMNTFVEQAGSPITLLLNPTPLRN